MSHTGKQECKGKYKKKVTKSDNIRHEQSVEVLSGMMLVVKDFIQKA